MEDNKIIVFHQAKEIAESAAKDQLEEFMNDNTINALCDYYLESEFCWFFFRNREIQGPQERALTWDRAYAVSKKGELRLIVDFFDQPIKLQQYLQVMSKHFE